MTRRLPLLLALWGLLFTTVSGAVRADDSRWHVLDRDDPLYQVGRPGAAIALGDRLAVIEHLPELGGWLATVVARLPSNVEAAIFSRLVYRDGSTASRRLDPQRVELRRDPHTGFVALSFAIEPGDVWRFRQASQWDLVLEGARLRIPLDGSHHALGVLLDQIGPPAPLVAAGCQPGPGPLCGPGSDG